MHVIIYYVTKKPKIERKGREKMIKYILRKTTCKEYNCEAELIIHEQGVKQVIIWIICTTMLWSILILLFTLISIFIIYICEKCDILIPTYNEVILRSAIILVEIVICYKIFALKIWNFSHLLTKKIYFLVYTTKGKAICKNDFKVIKHVNNKFYMFIVTQMCIGNCAGTSFSICKTLKKGSIEFLAIKELLPNDDMEGERKKFRMHVLYVNNGWAFDTYMLQQYPLEQLHQIYEAKVYKTFKFDEIRNKSFEEFREEQRAELTKWINENDCSMFAE